jgi:hypothetical protein
MGIVHAQGNGLPLFADESHTMRGIHITLQQEIEPAIEFLNNV